MGRHLGHQRAEHEIRERQQHVEIAIHPHMVNLVVPLDELEHPRPLDKSDGRLVHEIVEALIAHIIDRNTRRDRDHECEIRERDPCGVEGPCDQRPGRGADQDEQRASPPSERQGLVLLLIRDVEGVVELAELVVDQGVLGETVLGKPWPMQPVSVECPFHEAGLYDGDEGSY